MNREKYLCRESELQNDKVPINIGETFMINTKK